MRWLSTECAEDYGSGPPASMDANGHAIPDDCRRTGVRTRLHLSVGKVFRSAKGLEHGLVLSYEVVLTVFRS